MVANGDICKLAKATMLESARFGNLIGNAMLWTGELTPLAHLDMVLCQDRPFLYYGECIISVLI